MTEIAKAPQPILSQKAQTVEKISTKILKIIEEMKATLLKQANPKGVGLAAPQIGYPLRIFITKPTPKSPFSVFINPEIIEESKEFFAEMPKRPNPPPESGGQPLEGCLSLPGIWGRVARHKSLKLHYQTPEGKIHEGKFAGFLAVIIQHEMDHLEGRLFTQRVLEQKGKLYRITGKDKKGKNIWKEIEI